MDKVRYLIRRSISGLYDVEKNTFAIFSILLTRTNIPNIEKQDLHTYSKPFSRTLTVIIYWWLHLKKYNGVRWQYIIVTSWYITSRLLWQRFTLHNLLCGYHGTRGSLVIFHIIGRRSCSGTLNTYIVYKYWIF